MGSTFNRVSKTVIKMRMVFLHPVFSEEALQNHRVASHASNAWCKGLYQGVLSQGEWIATIGHIPAQIWPLGRSVYPNDLSQLVVGYNQHLVHYFNLPLIRTLSLCVGYRKAIDNVLSNKAVIVCTYNPLPWQVAAGRYAAQKGCHWVSFVLDDDAVAKRGWTDYKKLTAHASAHVFISKWAYDHAPVNNKIFLEGGIDRWQGNGARLSKVPSVMYAGAFTAACDMKLLTDLTKVITRPDVEFWICGKGNDSELRQMSKVDPRVKLLGFVTEEELHKRMSAAWVFVNPRSASHSGAKMNFPSKLLRYLSYGKPVVSNWTDGIPSDYKSIVEFVDSAEEMGSKIFEILNWAPRQFIEARKKIHDFLVPQKLWSTQSQRLIEKLNDIISPKQESIVEQDKKTFKIT